MHNRPILLLAQLEDPQFSSTVETRFTTGLRSRIFVCKSNVNPITFYFAEEGPGRGSETSRKTVTSTVLIFASFLSLRWTSWVEKSQQT
jgi:hypothetical protein